MADSNQDGIQHQADAILEGLRFSGATPNDEEPLAHPAQTGLYIHFACLYHPDDERHWKRLHRHLEVVSWQEQRYHDSRQITWHVHRLATPYADDSAKQAGYETLRQAHTLFLLLSVESLVALQRDEELFRLLRKKALEDRPEQAPPALVGILVRPAAWEDMEMGPWGAVLPTNNRPLALWRHRDEACTQIAGQVRKWIRKANTFMDRGTEAERGQHMTRGNPDSLPLVPGAPGSPQEITAEILHCIPIDWHDEQGVTVFGALVAREECNE